MSSYTTFTVWFMLILKPYDGTGVYVKANHWALLAEFNCQR
jgi:hypothetical protein